MSTFYGLGDEEPLGGPRSIVALPKRVECRAGEATSIALAYEAPAGSITASLGSVAKGTVTHTALTAIFTAEAGTAGEEGGFGFTLAQAGKSSSSRVTCVIVPGDDVPGDTESKELPTPDSTVTVTTMEALKGQLGSAPAGRRIILEDGDYPGDLNVTRSGTAGRPIQIYAKNKLLARITGRVTITGADVVISRVDVPKGIDLNGSRTRANRCRCNDLAAGQRNTILINGDDCTVDWCETSNFAAEGIRNAGFRNLIKRNVLTGKTASPAGTASAVISSGGGKVDVAKAFRCKIFDNLIYANAESDGIEIKSSENEIGGNTVLSGAGVVTNINNRYGMRNIYRRNWVEGGGQLQLSDEGTIAVRNKGRCAVNAGQITGDEFRAGSSGVVRADDAVVIDHDGAIEIGRKSNASCTKVPLRTILENCLGTITSTSGTYTTRAITAYPRPAAPKKLTTADVGPFGTP